MEKTRFLVLQNRRVSVKWPRSQETRVKFQITQMKSKVEREFLKKWTLSSQRVSEIVTENKKMITSLILIQIYREHIEVNLLCLFNKAKSNAYQFMMNKMNKFYKTGYSKRVENNIRNQVNPNQEAAILKQFGKGQIGSVFEKRQNLKTRKLQEVIENKIQIDPTLLFSHKNNVSRNSNYQEKQTQNKSEFKYIHMNQTSKQRFRERNQRPESKKQSRVRIWSRQRSADKTTQIKETSQRPQTSKCQRRIAQTRQNHATEQQYNGRILLNSRDVKHKMRPYSASGVNSRQSQLQTSLDPDFLSLFAN